MDTNTAVALSRIMAQQRAMDVTAGNIANAGTPGYRAERVQFSDWLSRQPPATSPRGGQSVAYAQDRATWRDETQGSLNHTGNPLDLALTKPDSWFTVSTANGPRLTRAGHFSLSAQGQIVDEGGNPVLDRQGQPIALGAADTNVTIAGDGTISSQNGRIGSVGIVSVPRQAAMQAEGARLFAASSPTQPEQAPHIVQGALEESNVQPVKETVAMTDMLRQFQFMTQFVQSEADRQQGAIDKLLTKRD